MSATTTVVFRNGDPELRHALAEKIREAASRDYGGIYMMTFGHWATDILAPHNLHILAYAIIADNDFDLPKAEQVFLDKLLEARGCVSRCVYLLLGISDRNFIEELKKWEQADDITLEEMIAGLAA
jgi:hypothetical protein